MRYTFEWEETWSLSSVLRSPAPRAAVPSSVWPLGDSPPVLVTALSDESSTSRELPSGPDVAVRSVYTDVDVRLLFGDMLAKLRRHEDRSSQTGLS